jgi:hypothetical protein
MPVPPCLTIEGLGTWALWSSSERDLRLSPSIPWPYALGLVLSSMVERLLLVPYVVVVVLTL